jgi:succinate dehydrogenase flavin-adding protein (antitoxin of CptAB toxin-antitoxin module)
MSALFNKQTFERNFSEALERITKSENITKHELKVVSRTMLEAWHITGNVHYVNRLLKAVTPVNKKALIVFSKHFGGFSYDEVLGEFTHKSKKRYENAHKLALEFLENPNNNLWTWAERHIEVQQKPFSIENVEKFIKGALNKGAGVGLSQVDILKAVFKAGVSPECVIQVMDELGFDLVEEPTQDFTIQPAPM